MGLFDFFKVYQASEFNGVLSKSGKPLAGIELKRKVDENDNYVTTQKTITDENGRFRFPSVYRYGLARFSIAENRYFQEITFTYLKNEYLGFYIAKSGWENNSEFSFGNNKNNREILELNFDCDITSEDKGNKYRTSTYLGICRLKN